MLYLSTSSGAWCNSSGDHSDLSGLDGSDSHNTSMDTARDAEDLLNEQLGESVLLVGGSFTDVSLGRSVHEVADSESLDSLVLSNASATVSTSDGLDMAATMLGSSVISSLHRHK